MDRRIESLATTPAILACGIAPEDWTDADRAELLERLQAPANQPLTPPTDAELKQMIRTHALKIAHETFTMEYGDLLKLLGDTFSVAELYAERVKLGTHKFHRWLGEEIQFKMFRDRFTATLLSRLPEEEPDLWDEFMLMRTNNWTHDQYARHLSRSRKA